MKRLQHVVIVTSTFQPIEAWLSNEGIKDVLQSAGGGVRVRTFEQWFGRRARRGRRKKT